MIGSAVESARHHWEDGARRLAREREDGERYAHLSDLVEDVQEELRRRLGQHFTLAELAALYATADEWVRERIEDALVPGMRVGIRDASLVTDAAFYRYARGARDWAP